MLDYENLTILIVKGCMGFAKPLFKIVITEGQRCQARNSVFIPLTLFLL